MTDSATYSTSFSGIPLESGSQTVSYQNAYIFRRSYIASESYDRMEEEHRSRLKQNKVALQGNLHIDEILLSHLIAEEVLTDAMKEQIDAEPTISTKASALLSLLPRRGPTAFRVFVEALIISGQKYLANLLDPIGTIAAQMEKSSLEEEETAPTEVSKETEEKGSNNEHESESKKEDSPEDQSTTTPEKSERVSYFEESEASFISIDLKPLCEKISHDQKVRFIETGHALVIINDRLSDRTSRDGSLYDEVNLCELFKKLNFEVDVKKNLSVEGIKEAMHSVRASCHDHIDGFVLCIMTTGECERIRDIDGKTISLDELRRYFNDDNCPTLKGKPRIFIVETCQDGIKSSDESESPGLDEVECDMKDIHIASEEARQNHNLMDICCSIKGRKKWRSDQYGSWFIRTVIRTVNEHAHHDDLLSLLLQVKNAGIGKGDADMSITVSPAEINKIYFHPHKSKEP